MPPLNSQQQLQNKQQEIFNKLKQDYETVFATEMGLRVLNDIIISAGIHKEIFSSDPLKMSHSEGKRCLGLHIAQMAKGESFTLKKQTAYRG